MKRIVAGYVLGICLLALVFWGIKQYYFSIGYIQPLFTDPNGISYIAKTENTSFYILDGEGEWQKSFLTGVDIGTGIPGYYPGDLAISEDDYFDWFTKIADMGSNVIRVYVPQAPEFYKALYEYNKAAATPLYLIQGVYMDENDVKKYTDVFADGSSVIGIMKEDIIDCINMIHGNAAVGAAVGKASGVYAYDVSKYVIGWILGIECEAYFVNGTNRAHPDLSSFDGEYVYTENTSAFEVFIAQMEDLAISYETEHYSMQRPVAFCNWITTDPLAHENEPLETEDSAVIDAEHIKAKDTFGPGFFASYHVYPYYPDFLSYTSGNETADANPYLAYLKDLTAYHTMPVLVSEFGLPTSRGVTHINHLTGLDQGGNTEEEQGEGLVSLLDDIHASGCMGGIVFSWQDEWFKTSWNTTDFDDAAARAKWLDVESSEQNFGILSFDTSERVRIDGDDSEWTKDDRITADGTISVQSDEAYLYLRVGVDDFNNGTYYIPIDTISGEGSLRYKGTPFEREADFVLVLDGQNGTRLLVDPYYNPNYKLYGDTSIFSEDRVRSFEIAGSGTFETAFQVISRALVLPTTGETVAPQLYETGRMVYGDSNPDSADYNSLADFCAGDGFVELRIPWLLLNFADPSSGKILSNLHTGDAIAYQQTDKLYLGLGKAGEGTIGMSAWDLSFWTEPTYTQRLKQSYDLLKDGFKAYATYAANISEDLARALKARDVRLLYIRLDRQMDRTAMVVYLLMVAFTLVIYLVIVLVAVNLSIDRRQRKNGKEKEILRGLLKSPGDIGPFLNMRFLRTGEGMNTLYELLTEIGKWEDQKNFVNALCRMKYPEWMRKRLKTRGLWRSVQILKLAGMMHLREFEAEIVPLMEKHKDNLDVQYIGFLALSMMGNRDTIVRLCNKPGYTKVLSYRCLKEIFAEYTGDKRFLYEKLLNCKDAYIRRICIKGIGDEGFAEFAGDLVPLLDSGDENLLCDVIRSLGQLRFAKAGDRILEFTKSENWTLRNVAFVALGAIDGGKYADRIEEGLSDPEWWVRYNSAMELCSIEGPEALRARQKGLTDRFAVDIIGYAISEAELLCGKAVAT